jgi:hypothetical protein
VVDKRWRRRRRRRRDFKIVPKDLFSQILSFLPPSSSTLPPYKYLEYIIIKNIKKYKKI